MDRSRGRSAPKWHLRDLLTPFHPVAHPCGKLPSQRHLRVLRVGGIDRFEPRAGVVGVGLLDRWPHIDPARQAIVERYMMRPTPKRLVLGGSECLVHHGQDRR